MAVPFPEGTVEIYNAWGHTVGHGFTVAKPLGEDAFGIGGPFVRQLEQHWVLHPDAYEDPRTGFRVRSPTLHTRRYGSLVAWSEAARTHLLDGGLWSAKAVYVIANAVEFADLDHRRIPPFPDVEEPALGAFAQVIDGHSYVGATPAGRTGDVFVASESSTARSLEHWVLRRGYQGPTSTETGVSFNAGSAKDEDEFFAQMAEIGDQIHAVVIFACVTLAKPPRPA